MQDHLEPILARFDLARRGRPRASVAAEPPLVAYGDGHFPRRVAVYAGDRPRTLEFAPQSFELQQLGFEALLRVDEGAALRGVAPDGVGEHGPLQGTVLQAAAVVDVHVGHTHLGEPRAE